MSTIRADLAVTLAVGLGGRKGCRCLSIFRSYPANGKIDCNDWNLIFQDVGPSRDSLCRPDLDECPIDAVLQRLALTW